MRQASQFLLKPGQLATIHLCSCRQGSYNPQAQLGIGAPGWQGAQRWPLPAGWEQVGVGWRWAESSALGRTQPDANTTKQNLSQQQQCPCGTWHDLARLC